MLSNESKQLVEKWEEFWTNIHRISSLLNDPTIKVLSEERLELKLSSLQSVSSLLDNWSAVCSHMCLCLSDSGKEICPSKWYGTDSLSTTVTLPQEVEESTPGITTQLTPSELQTGGFNETKNELKDVLQHSWEIFLQKHAEYNAVTDIDMYYPWKEKSIVQALGEKYYRSINQVHSGQDLTDTLMDMLIVSAMGLVMLKRWDRK